MKTMLRTTYSSLASMFALVLLGATPHVDEYLRFTVRGEVSCNPVCGHPFVINLVASNLGNTVADKQIASATLSDSGDGSFLLMGSIALGYTGKPDVVESDRAIALEMRGHDCPAFRKSLPLRNFVRDKYGYLIDIGRIKMECSSLSQ